jgi:hypothetical protein
MIKIYYLEENSKIFYVGKTNVPLNNRLYEHRHSKQRKCSIHLLDEVPDNEWKFWESWWIELFKSWGFELENKNDGGGGRKEISQEEIEWRKTYFKGKTRTEEQKQNMRKPKSSSVKGEKHGLFGTKQSEEHRKNKSEAAKRINGSQRNKAVEQIKDGKTINTFISAAEAERVIGISGVRRVCQGRGKSCGGYQWKYKI